MFKELKLKNLGNYHDFYVQSDTLLLAGVFENFRNKCIKIYRLDLAHFLSASGLAWQACLKKNEVELELLTNIDTLLMAEKGTRGKICQEMHRYVKTKNKYMKNYHKNTTSSYLMYLDANNLHGFFFLLFHLVHNTLRTYKIKLRYFQKQDSTFMQDKRLLRRIHTK